MKKLIKKIKKIVKKVNDARTIGGWKISPKFKVYTKKDDQFFYKRDGKA